MTAISVRGVSRAFDGPVGTVEALRNVDLGVSAGTMAAIRGRSGSGKTTLLNLIGALDRPTSGSVTVLGTRVDQLSTTDAAAWRTETLGFVFQAHALMPSMTAYENVELALRIRGVSRKARRDRTLDSLSAVGLSERVDHRPGALSGGQRQRVAVARAIAPGADLLIADEPTAGLDSATAVDVFELLRSLVDDRGITIVMATHDPLSDGFVDSATHLEKGRLIIDELSRP